MRVFWRCRKPVNEIKNNELGRLVRKPVNANPGLKVNRSINLSCTKMAVTAKTENFIEKLRNSNQNSANAGLALSGFEQLGPDFTHVILK